MYISLSFITIISVFIAYQDCLNYKISVVALIGLCIMIPRYHFEYSSGVSFESVICVGLIIQVLYRIPRLGLQIGDVILIHIVSTLLQEHDIVNFFISLTIIAGCLSTYWKMKYKSNIFPLGSAIVGAMLIQLYSGQLYRAVIFTG